MDLDAVTCTTPLAAIAQDALSVRCAALESLEWEQSTDGVRLLVRCAFVDGAACRISSRRLVLSVREVVLLSEVLAKEVDAVASTWRVAGDRTIEVELRKRRRREWFQPFAVPYPSMRAAAAATARPRHSETSAPQPHPLTNAAAAHAAPPSARSAKIDSKYARWERFDEIAALTQVENEDLPAEPGLRVEASAGKAHIEYTDYAKSVEEVGLDQELKAKSAVLLRDISQRLADAALVKRGANECFKAGNYEGAAEGYARAIALLGEIEMMLPIMAPRLKRRSVAMVVDLHNNLAAAELKRGALGRARSCACVVLKLESANAKALFRRARAATLLAEAKAGTEEATQLIAAARSDLERLLVAAPANAPARRALAALLSMETSS